MALAACSADPETAPSPGAASHQPASGVLVLYDTTGQFGDLGELYAVQAGNLASHFDKWRPAGDPVHGRQRRPAPADVYIGSTYDEPLPDAFLADVAAARPVLWMGENIWQLPSPSTGGRRAAAPLTIDDAAVTTVRYHDADPRRRPRRRHASRRRHREHRRDPRRRGARRRHHTPWAVRFGALTYLAEVPFTYVTSDDRYLVFADLLFGLLEPGAPQRHRALVRIEDVGPHSDPAQLRTIADYLSAPGVPFSVAVFVRVRRRRRPLQRRVPGAPEAVPAPPRSWRR